MAASADFAQYRVVKDSKRTSGIIHSGMLRVDVERRTSDSLPTTVTYRLQVKFYGDFAGKQSIMIPKEYFTKAFLQELRVSKVFKGENFTVKHMGFGKTKDYHGKIYENCDLLYFFDIKTVGRHYYKYPTRHRNGGRVIRINQEIKNPRILAHIKYGLPVIGAVSLDMKGKFMGINGKIGADLY
jgi:hypothetical protein